MTKITNDKIPSGSDSGLSRRNLLRAAGTVGMAAPLGALGSRVFAGTPGAGALDALCGPGLVPAAAAGPAKTLRLAWNASSVCLSPVALAAHQGIFEKHGVKVELINFGGATEQLLEAIATGKADAGVGMALRWLKPLEQGFDVKITAGTHGGCLRLLGSKAHGISDLVSLKGKTIAVGDMAGPAKNFFSIMLTKRGVDPDRDVTWRQYPSELLPLAIEKGEAQALADQDPRTYLFIKESQGNLVEVASNLSEEYSQRVCCILGIRGSLLREDRATASALTKAVLEAQQAASHHPETAAETFRQYTPKASKDDIVAMLKDQMHHHSPVGAALKEEIRLYAEELKLVRVFKPRTDPARFADRVYEDVLS